MTASEVAERLRDLPEGYFEVFYRGRRYGVTINVFNQGRSLKLLARELGGTDMVSLNFYQTRSGELLKPCEMPVEKITDFLSGLSLA